MAAKAKGQKKKAPKKKSEEPSYQLTEADVEIIAVITYAVRGERLPRSLRHAWREPYNEIALVLRDQMRGQDIELEKAETFVRNYVIAERTKPKGPRAGRA